MRMANRYSNEGRQEAVKLAREIGSKTASERLGINLDTLYTWISKDKKHTARPRLWAAGISVWKITTSKLNACRRNCTKPEKKLRYYRMHLVFS